MAGFISFLILGFMAASIDCRKHIIPNQINLAISLLQLIFIPSPAHAIGSGLIASSLLLIPSLITGGSIGMGDVKFQFGIGIFLSTLPLISVLVSLEISLIVGCLVLVLRKVLRRRSLTTLPFGPFLYCGAITTFLFA